MRDSIRAQLRRLEAEIARLKEANDIEILDLPRLEPSPKTLKKFLLLFVAGAFMGLVLGSMLALVLRYADITVKNELDVAQMLGKRVLAIIPRLEEVVPVEEAEGEEAGEVGEGAEVEEGPEASQTAILEIADKVREKVLSIPEIQAKIQEIAEKFAAKSREAQKKEEKAEEGKEEETEEEVEGESEEVDEDSREGLPWRVDAEKLKERLIGGGFPWSE